MSSPMFSIIVPVYGVEKYIAKCLDSIAIQTFDNYEVIIVNDGSPDNSQAIIDEFVKKDCRMKSYQKPNGGLSDARNFGVAKAIGKYLLFVDSDDFIESDLLARIGAAQSGQDLIRFFHREISESGNILSESVSYGGEVPLPARYQFSLVEAAWLYAYRRSFWLANKFEYAVGRLHEDFGLTPIILAKAGAVLAIDYIGYNYLQREASIMSDPKKRQRRMEDIQWFYSCIEHNRGGMRHDAFWHYANFIANGLVSLAITMDINEARRFATQLRILGPHKYFLRDNPRHLVKYITCMISPAVFIYYLRRTGKRTRSAIQ